MQFGGPVGRADDEGYSGGVGLDDGRMELDCCRTARRDDDRRAPVPKGHTDCEKAGRALVDADGHSKPLVLCGRQGERSRTRPGTKDHVSHPRPAPLVEEGGAQGGLRGDGYRQRP